MEQIDYDEIVKLLMPGTTKVLTLTQAVREVIHTEDMKVRMAAVIVRDGPPIMKSAEIETIYVRPDFPK